LRHVETHSDQGAATFFTIGPISHISVGAFGTISTCEPRGFGGCSRMGKLDWERRRERNLLSKLISAQVSDKSRLIFTVCPSESDRAGWKVMERERERERDSQKGLNTDYHLSHICHLLAALCSLTRSFVAHTHKHKKEKNWIMGKTSFMYF